MVSIIKGLRFSQASYSHTMRKTLIFFVTACFLFLGTVNAAPKAKIYGPVKSGQTLWSIAYSTRPKGVSRLKMMNALHKLNPSAFEKGNINLLMKGATLKIPRSRKEVARILAGDTIEITEIKDDSNKDIETLKIELASIKGELLKSKEALKGLNQQSEVLKQIQQKVVTLTRENEALKHARQEDIGGDIKAELSTITGQYKKAQQYIRELEAEKAQLLAVKETENTAQQQAESLQELTAVSAELTSAKKLIKTLAEKNKALQENSLDPKLLESTRQELALTHEELEALKVQNQLLLEQTANADNVSQQQESENNKKFSETIAALNADIGVLRSRIKELEDVVVMKDTHITKLQDSLDHATTVISKQVEVNKKIFARLKELEEKEAENEQQVAATMIEKDPSNQTPPVSQPAVEMAGKEGGSTASSVVNFTGKSEKTNLASIAGSNLKDISPKFWLMLTLASLLFVFALLWRVISGKDDLETPC